MLIWGNVRLAYIFCIITFFSTTFAFCKYLCLVFYMNHQTKCFRFSLTVNVVLVMLLYLKECFSDPNPYGAMFLLKGSRHCGHYWIEVHFTFTVVGSEEAPACQCPHAYPGAMGLTKHHACWSLTDSPPIWTHLWKRRGSSTITASYCQSG